jgi:molybdenum cofactor cytidylyltransferase
VRKGALESTRMTVAAIVLAAGASTRMGRPKPLVPIDGIPLLRRVVSTALASRARPLLVVVGAAEEAARAGIEGLSCTIVPNPRWRDGQSSSIAAGVRHLREHHPGAEAALVLLGDQPFVSAGTLDALLRAREGGASIAACESGGILRPPALFATRWFDELEALAGDSGARRILDLHRADVAAVPLPEGEDVDFDTPEDLARLPLS